MVFSMRMFAAMAVAITVTHAQTPSPLQFDVASIKPNESGANIVEVRLVPGGRLVARNTNVTALITSAWNIRNFQLADAPGWAGSLRYDIDAQGPAGLTENEMSQMLQLLLAERFQLKVHKETREMPVYVLMPARNGSKLQPAAGGNCFQVTPGVPLPTADARPCGGFNMMPGHMTGAKVTMERFTGALSRYLGRVVTDKTGLTSSYDITLQWTPDDTEAFLRGLAQPADESGPSLFTAIQEQLGLRLEAQKGPVEMLVIDRVEKPSAN